MPKIRGSQGIGTTLKKRKWNQAVPVTECRENYSVYVPPFEYLPETMGIIHNSFHHPFMTIAKQVLGTRAKTLETVSFGKERLGY